MNFCPLPLVLSVDATEEGLSLSHSFPPIKYLYLLVRLISPGVFSFSTLKSQFLPSPVGEMFRCSSLLSSS